MGSVSLGYGPDGKRIRRKVFGKTKQEVRDRLKALHKGTDVGVKSSHTYTVREAVEDWLREGLDGTSDRTRTLYEGLLGPLLDLIGANNVIRAFRIITKKAGLGEDWVPREMRHTFVSVLSANRVPVESIALLAGHDRTATIESVYRHEIRPCGTGLRRNPLHADTTLAGLVGSQTARWLHGVNRERLDPPLDRAESVEALGRSAAQPRRTTTPRRR